MAAKPSFSVSDGVEPRREPPHIRVRRLQIFLHNADLEKDWYYSERFWDGYFDFLARCRYNEFNLVFGHQTSHLIPLYAYLFAIDDYPDVRVEGLSDQAQARNLAALQMISKMAHDRGLGFWIGLWQSKPWAADTMGGQRSPVRGLDGIDLGNYTLRGIVKLLKLCPNISGIQLRMNRESGLRDQAFFRDIFIPGLRDCGRDSEVEIRNWGLERETLEQFREAFPRLRVSFKYFAEHQAMPYQPVQMCRSYSYDSLLRNDKKYEVAWHVWNLGTHRLFLWGDPDYVKAFVRSCHLGNAIGFEVTPPLSQKGFSQFGQTSGYWSIYRDGVQPGYYEWEYQRYWFFYMLWGLLGYDHEMDDEPWLGELARRFGADAAPHMLEAYKESSKVVSYLVAHHMDDPNMYTWHEMDAGGHIDYFGSTCPGEKTLFLSARDYARQLISGELSAKVTPWQAAEDLEGFAGRCQAALARAEENEALGDNEEFRFTRLDMDALCALARYNAQKIRASAYLYLFYETVHLPLLDRAEEHAREGKRIWEDLARITEPFYDELNLGPTGGHWRKQLLVVESDLRRLEAVRETFLAYGNFDRGFDFGRRFAARGRGNDREATDYDLLEPRFTRFGPDDDYSAETGYGWEARGELKDAGPAAPSLGACRGSIRANEEALPEYPANFLHLDSISSADPAELRVDLPDGTYELTLGIGDAPEQAADGNRMSVRADGEPVATDVPAPTGRVELVKARVEVQGGALRVGLSAEAGGRWTLSALSICPLGDRGRAAALPAWGQEAREPHVVHHTPLHRHDPSKPMPLTTRLDDDAKAADVRLHYRTVDQNAEFRVVSMGRRGNGKYTATIPASDLDPLFDEMYFFEVANRSGGGSFYPDPFGGKRYFVVRTTPPRGHDTASEDP